jgi:hypothetical protein
MTIETPYLPGDMGTDVPAFFREVGLDLLDPTGRFHASMWFDQHVDSDRWPNGFHHLDDALGPGHYEAVVAAGNADTMDAASIEKLRAAVLYAAKLADSTV